MEVIDLKLNSFLENQNAIKNQQNISSNIVDQLWRLES